MKKLIGRLIFQLFILLIFLSVVNKLLPYHWANGTYTAKMKYFKNTEKEYNVLFFGSSSTHVQLMPSVFDYETNLETKSFNLGSPATFNPENYFFLDKLISKKASRKTYLFIDIINVGDIHETNLHTIRAKYYLGPSQYLFFLKDFINKTSTYKKNKIHVLRNYSITLFENIFKINFRKDVIKFILGEYDEGCPLGEHGDGQCSYEYEKSQLSESSGKRKGLELRQKNFQSGGQLRLKNLNHKISTNSSNESHLQARKDYQFLINYLSKTQQKAIKNNYYPIFFIMPPGGYHKIPILSSLDKEHVIDLINPKKYPNLFKPEYHFDEGHLTEQGSIILTKALAEEFNRLIK